MSDPRYSDKKCARKECTKKTKRGTFGMPREFCSRDCARAVRGDGWVGQGMPSDFSPRIR